MNDEMSGSEPPETAIQDARASDPVWATAWDWIRRQHELMLASEEDVSPLELIEWLAADPLHRKAYDEAGRVWLAAGLLPPEEDAPAREREQA